MEYITIQRSDGVPQRVPLYGGGATPTVNAPQPPLPLPVYNFGGDDDLKVTQSEMGLGNYEAHQAPPGPQPNYAGAATINADPNYLPLPVMNFDGHDYGHGAGRGGHRGGGGTNNAKAAPNAPAANSGVEGNLPPAWEW